MKQQLINWICENYIENINLDTYDKEEIFFSFRRSLKQGKKDYGRCISTIRLIKN